MRLALAIALVWIPLAGAQEPALPPPPVTVDELRPLRELMHDEQRAIDSLRQFHRAQEELFRMDIELAEEYARAGDVASSQAKVDQANARIALVRNAYEEFLAHYPQNPQGLNYYGEVLYDHYKQFAGAIEKWRLSAALDSKFSAPRNNLSLHYFHNGDYHLGFRYMEEAMKLDPNNPDYLFNAAQIYLVHFPEVQKHKKWEKERVYREAMKMSRQAAQLLPHDYELQEDYAVNFFAAENFGIEPNWRDAAGAWQTARTRARTEEELFYTWLNEARVWLRVQEWNRAEACLVEALAILPDSTAANNLLATVQQGKTGGG